MKRGALEMVESDDVRKKLKIREMETKQYGKIYVGRAERGYKCRENKRKTGKAENRWKDMTVSVRNKCILVK